MNYYEILLEVPALSQTTSVSMHPCKKFTTSMHWYCSNNKDCTYYFPKSVVWESYKDIYLYRIPCWTFLYTFEQVLTWGNIRCVCDISIPPIWQQCNYGTKIKVLYCHKEYMYIC